MRITTAVTFEILDEIGEYREISRESFEYDGPVALAKKGREANQANTKFQQGQAQEYADQGQTMYNYLNQIMGEELGQTTPGSMSPAASAMYSSDMDRINNVYNGMRQQAFANNANRGFGGAPSGFSQSAQNAINQGQGQAATAAYRQGILNTEQQRQNAANLASGARNSSIAGSEGMTNAANTSAFNQSRMGSTLGDVAQGIGDAVGIAGSVFGMPSGVGNFYSGAGAHPTVPSGGIQDTSAGAFGEGGGTFGNPNMGMPTIPGLSNTSNFVSDWRKGGIGNY